MAPKMKKKYLEKNKTAGSLEGFSAQVKRKVLYQCGNSKEEKLALTHR
jgi:hypothetical protein